jgi:hypothetical protein
MYLRVFGRTDLEPSPAALAADLHAAGLAVEPHFKGDDLGWTGGELRFAGGGTGVLLQRYLTAEDDLRDELDAFAAVLETCDYSPHAAGLMQLVIQTKQLVTLRRPVDASDEATLDDVLLRACQFLAYHTDGVYQIDGQGWFDPAGVLLVQEY